MPDVRYALSNVVQVRTGFELTRARLALRSESHFALR